MSSGIHPILLTQPFDYFRPYFLFRFIEIGGSIYLNPRQLTCADGHNRPFLRQNGEGFFVPAVHIAASNTVFYNFEKLFSPFRTEPVDPNEPVLPVFRIQRLGAKSAQCSGARYGRDGRYATWPYSIASPRALTQRLTFSSRQASPINPIRQT